MAPPTCRRPVSERSTPLPARRGRSPLGIIEIQNLTAAWRDDASRWRVELAPMSLRLNGDHGILRGPLGSRGESVVARGDVRTGVVRLDGDLGFDGAALDIHRLTVAAPEGGVTVRGRIEALFAGPRLDLDYAAQLDVAELASWLSDASVAGTLSAEGSASGRLDALAASVTIAGDGLAWQATRIERVAATAQVTGSELRLDALDLTLAGGRLSAEGRLTRNDARAGRLVSTSGEKRAIPNRSSTTTCRGSCVLRRRTRPVWTSVRGAAVKAVSPAKRGRSAATRLDCGEHTRTLSASTAPAYHDILWSTASEKPAHSCAREQLAARWRDLDADRLLRISASSLPSRFAITSVRRVSASMAVSRTSSVVAMSESVAPRR